MTKQARELLRDKLELLGEHRLAGDILIRPVDDMNGSWKAALHAIDSALDRSAQILAMMRENTDPTCNEVFRKFADEIEASLPDLHIHDERAAIIEECAKVLQGTYDLYGAYASETHRSELERKDMLAHRATVWECQRLIRALAARKEQ